MVVAYLEHHFCRRANSGRKSHAHAAYISGTKLDDGYGHTADFTPKGGILHAEVWAPKDAPAWAKDRGELWRRLEAREDKTTRHAKAILAHKFIGALPHELSLEENIRYVKDFVREQFTRRGYAADWAIHAPDPGSDSRNYHVHIMVPLRKFENGDWAKTKDRFPKNSPALSKFIKEKQQAFFELQNRYLQKNGIAANICRKNGKWTVVQGPASAPSRPGTNATATTFVTMQGRNPALVTQPIVRPSQAPTFGGGSSNNRTSLRDVLLHAARATATSQSEPAVATIKLNPNTNGWPLKAIEDWGLWGHKNPRRFFALWPQCASGNPAPGGGV